MAGNVTTIKEATTMKKTRVVSNVTTVEELSDVSQVEISAGGLFNADKNDMLDSVTVQMHGITSSLLQEVFD